AILNHDPSLEVPDVPGEGRLLHAPSVAEKSPTTTIRRSRTSLRREVSFPPDSVVMIDPEQARAAGYVPVGRRPVARAGGDAPGWGANDDGGTVWRIEAGRREVIRTSGVGAPAIDLSSGPDAVWVANGSEGTVSRIDPVADAIVETIDLRGSSEL